VGKGPQLVVKGTQHSIYYASCDGGREPAREYLEGIGTSNPNHEARFIYILERFANGQQTRDSVKKLEGDSDLIEFKIPKMEYRLLGYYLPGRRTILLTGFDKKATKMKQKGHTAIETAIEVKRLFEEIHRKWCEQQSKPKKR